MLHLGGSIPSGSHDYLTTTSADCALSKPQALACLLALDKLDFIALRAQNRYSLKIDRQDLPLAPRAVLQYFREHAAADYYSGGFDGPGELSFREMLRPGA